MKANPLQDLLDVALRRPLTRSEQDRLAALLASQGPGPGEDWRVEQELTRVLGRLPDAPLSSNFTARVLQALETEAAPSSWTARVRAWAASLNPVPRYAAAGLALLLLAAGYVGQQGVSRSRAATSLARITGPVTAAAQAAQLSPVEILQDYQAIERIPLGRDLADEELLVALAPVTGGRNE